MNPVIAQLQGRRSIRQFTGEQVSDDDLQRIFETAQRAPTSNNAQQSSLVYTRDKEVIRQIAELCGGQKQVETADVFVCVVVDFNRTAHAVEAMGKTQVIEQSAEGILVGAVDAGIMLMALQTAAEALGYGTTAIGAIRNDPETMIRLLGLPPKTFPIVGSTIGVPTPQSKTVPLKPRMPLESFAMPDRYDTEAVKEGTARYEGMIRHYRETNGMGQLPSYNELVGGLYSGVPYRKVAQNLRAQGFEFKDEL